MQHDSAERLGRLVDDDAVRRVALVLVGQPVDVAVGEGAGEHVAGDDEGVEQLGPAADEPGGRVPGERLRVRQDRVAAEQQRRVRLLDGTPGKVWNAACTRLPGL